MDQIFFQPGTYFSMLKALREKHAALLNSAIWASLLGITQAICSTGSVVTAMTNSSGS